MALAFLGGLILWLGWFGFNPGSTTTAGGDLARIAVTTNLAASAAAIAAMFASWVMAKKPDASMALNGALAGLVAITCPCDAVTPGGAVLIGLVAGVLVVASVLFIDRVLKIDDPVGAVSVHGVCGAWGTLSYALFNIDGFSMAKLGAQLTGIAAGFIWAFGGGLVLFYLIKATVGLRASPEEELRGLDLSEHGMEAYSGFQIFRTQ